MRSLRSMPLLLLMLGSVGCASLQKMPLQSAGPAPDFSKQGVLVARVKIRNDNKKSHQPTLLCVLVNQKHQTSETLYSFTTPTLLSENGEAGKDYFASIGFEPGPVRIETVRFMRQIPLLLNAVAEVPLKTEIDVAAGKVIYLGSIEAVIVPKDPGDDAAGSPLPLIDQAVAGFSNGKWQIRVNDDFDADVTELKLRYPFLQDAVFEKHILAVPAKLAAPATAPAVDPVPQA